MEDEWDFDDSLLQAVDQYESSYFSSRAQQQHAKQAPAEPQQPAQQQQRQGLPPPGAAWGPQHAAQQHHHQWQQQPQQQPHHHHQHLHQQQPHQLQPHHQQQQPHQQQPQHHQQQPHQQPHQQQPQQQPQQAHPPPAQQLQQQHRQPLAPSTHYNTADVASIWQLFCSQPPTCGPGSACTGWASKRLHGRPAAPGGSLSAKQQTQQQYGAGMQQQQQQHVHPAAAQRQGPSVAAPGAFHASASSSMPWQPPGQQQPAGTGTAQAAAQAAAGAEPPAQAPAAPAPAAAPAAAAAAAAAGAPADSLGASSCGGLSGAAAVSGAARSGAAAASGGAAGSGGAPVVYTARLQLGTRGNVEVSFSGFHEEIASLFAAIPGAKPADAAGWARRWLLPADKLPQLEGSMKQLKAVRIASLEPLPPLVSNVLRVARRRPDDSALYAALGRLELAPGESLEARMMPFQREGVRFGLRAGGRLLIGDEMGLGKTVQAAALALCYRAEWPVLIVTPSSLRLCWAAALYDWLRVTEDRVCVVLKKAHLEPLANAASKAAARGMADFVVVSYDLLKDVGKVLAALEFEVVILDESHCIKNPKAQRTRFAVPLVKAAKRAILLSGTPALSRPAELLTPLQALLPGANITKAAFEERYTTCNSFGAFRKPTGSKNEEELYKLLTSSVMVRRRKAEVLKDLPPKMRKQVLLMLPTKQRAELDKLKAQLNDVRKLTTDMHGLGAAAGSAAGGLLQGMQAAQQNMIMALWHQTARLKADAVAEYVTELLTSMSGSDDKFLVFAYHRELLDAVERAVNGVRSAAKGEARGQLDYMRIDGQTPPAAREAAVTKFQETQACRVALLNIKAAGVGLTLTRASTVVFAELAWTPSEVLQAEDRAHRIGQTHCVSVQLLLVKDSIDELMWEMLQSKLATTGQVLDGQAERMEVDRTSTAHPRGSNQGAAAAGPSQAAAAAADSGQKSITSFFAAAPAGGGGRRADGAGAGASGAAAGGGGAKKQRVE